MNLLSDVRYALRALRKSPGFAAVALLTLAVGIGASTAMYSVVRGVLLAPLPYHRPAQLYAINESMPGMESFQIRWSLVNPLHFRRWQRDCSDFAGMAIAQQYASPINGGGEPPAIAEVGAVSADFLSVLGVRPILGRNFLASEDHHGANHFAILSDALWRRRFAANPAVLGHELSIDNTPYTVVGILPASFRWPFPSRQVEVLEPIGIGPGHDRWTGDYNFEAVARLRSGAPPRQALAQLDAVESQIAVRWTPGKRLWADLIPLPDLLVGPAKSGLLLLFGSVLAVLLIGCVNLANLALARMRARRSAAAVQAALGASRVRLLRSLLTESLVLAALGGAAGLLLADWGISALLWLAPAGMPRLDNVRLDAWALFFAALLTLVSGLAFGFWPAWRASRVDPQAELRAGGRGAGEDRAGRRLGQTLVGLEVGLSVALLIAAGLLIHSFARLAAQPKGFDGSDVVTVAIDLPGGTYDTAGKISRFQDAAVAKIRALPSVAAASFTTELPLGGDSWFDGIHLPGDHRPSYEQPEAQIRFVRGGYFAALGIPILRGRDFNHAEQSPARKSAVAIVSRRMADELWPGQDAVGQTFYDGDTPLRVIGIAGDVLSNPVERPPVLAYEPFYLADFSNAALVVRAAASPAALVPAIRKAIWSVDGSVPVPRFETMASVAAAAVGERAFQMRLMLTFALVALLLAALGVYGVISYTVSRRTGELGLRAALGARPQEIAALVLRQGLRPVAWGLGAGVAAALLSGRALASLLFQVRADDPWAFGLATLALAAVSVVACWLPARRAARVDPMQALRCE